MKMTITIMMTTDNDDNDFWEGGGGGWLGAVKEVTFLVIMIN